MPGSLRYKNAMICEHLASQYVAGSMTPRVRSRVDVLRNQYPELDRTIISWAEKIAPLHDSLEEKTVSAAVWHRIESSLFSVASEKDSKSSIWHNLRFWQFTGIGATFASVVFAALLLVLPVSSPKLPVVSSTPSYLAVMSPVAEGVRSNDIRFVVNVYQKTEQSPSKLFIQWSEHQSRSLNEGMHLWAKDRNTGELSYVGVEPSDATPWNLNKTTWQAVSNSSELLFTRTADIPSEQNTLFIGPCIQLGSWKQDLNS
ncbi:hypothetical protein OAH87_00510 [Marinomonas sp.]|nr:hypothetical protein [Marinomonas sp.]MDB4836935.1 hypothetical protein [Marinomonas sp.]